MKVFEIEYGGKKRKLMFGMFAILIFRQNVDSKSIDQMAEIVGIERELLLNAVLIYAGIKCYNIANKDQEDVTLDECLLWLNGLSFDDTQLVNGKFAEANKHATGIDIYQTEDGKKKASQLTKSSKQQSASTA